MAIKKIELDYKLNFFDWTKIVHPNADGYVTVAIRTLIGWSERNYTVEEWYKYIVRDEKTDCYYSVNGYYKPHRATENARHINAFYVDIDFYKQAKSLEEVTAAIDFLIETERLLPPTFLVDSGRGLYAFWQIESVPAKFKNVQKLYSHIQKFLIDTLKDLGADEQACDIARVLRVPTTYNTKTGRKVEILSYTEKFYTMRYMQQFMNDALMIDLDEKKPKNKLKKHQRTNLKRLFNAYTLAIARANDLKALVKMRNYELNGYRNAILHIYAYQMFLVHDNYFIARKAVVEFNEELSDPIERMDLLSLFRATFKAYEKHREDVTKGYNYRNLTIIDKLDITVDEQQQLKTIISKSEKYRRNNTRRQNARKIDGLTARERSLNNNLNKVATLLEKGLKQTQIAQELNLDKGYVSKLVKRLKKQS